jgi:hypothetical protein
LKHHKLAIPAVVRNSHDTDLQTKWKEHGTFLKIFCGMGRTWVAARHPKKWILLEHRFAGKVQAGDASPAAG